MAPVQTTNTPVDTRFGGRYKAALFFLWALLAVPTPARAGSATVKGVVLPPGSQQVGEDRFKSPSNYADTLTFYSKQYRNNPRKSIVNQPGIRAVHLVNDGKGAWEGLNIYELDGETKIFVVARDSPKSASKSNAKKP